MCVQLSANKVNEAADWGIHIHAINRMDHATCVCIIHACMYPFPFHSVWTQLVFLEMLITCLYQLMGSWGSMWMPHILKHSPYYKGIKLLIVPFCRENHRDIIRTPPKNVMSLIIIIHLDLQVIIIQQHSSLRMSVSIVLVADEWTESDISTPQIDFNHVVRDVTDTITHNIIAWYVWAIWFIWPPI